MVDGSSAIWFGAPNFRVLDVVDDGHELTISVESTVTVSGCAACGTRAKPKDRRWVGLRDAPSGDRAVVVGVQESNATFLQYLDKVKLSLGTSFQALERFDYDGSMKIALNENEEITISHKVCENLFAQKIK